MAEKKEAGAAVEDLNDPSMLLKVEDLIRMSIMVEPQEKNVAAVNFKLLQTVLYILARHMRLLNQQVDMRIEDQNKQLSSAPTEQENELKLKDKAQKLTEKAARKELAQKQRTEENAARKQQKHIERKKDMLPQDSEANDGDSSTNEDIDNEPENMQKSKQTRTNKEKGERDTEVKEKSSEGKSKEKSGKTKKEDKDEGTGRESGKTKKDAKDNGAGKDMERTTKESKEIKSGKPSTETSDKHGKLTTETSDKHGKPTTETSDKHGKPTTETSDKHGKPTTETSDKHGKPTTETSDKHGKPTTETSDGAGKSTKAMSEMSGKSASGMSDRSGNAATGLSDKSGKSSTVMKGGATAKDKPVQRVGSIEVVTMKQFAALEEAVKELERKTGPLPPPVMPDNKKLVADISRGKASLSDTMEAMKLSSRVEAAEKAIGRMTEMLTELAGTGALPDEYVSKALDIRGDLEHLKHDITSKSDKTKADKADTISIASKKSVFIDPASRMDHQALKPSSPSDSIGPALSLAGPSTHASAVHTAAGGQSLNLSSHDSHAVTRLDLENALHALRNELMLALPAMTDRATNVADSAMTMIKSVAEKLDIAAKLNSRISHLYSLISDYAEQLKGFDAGLKQQMAGFSEQMTQMRGELDAGIAQLENVNNNAETAAVLELKEKFEVVLQEFEISMHHHGKLTDYLRELRDELKSLVDCVEMIKEQKADRDEIMDGLRDKADISCLEGLLTEERFAVARCDLETHLEICYNTFKMQDAVWMGAIQDFHETISAKAELMLLLGMRDDAQNSLRDVHDSVRKLELILGDPKTAILIRELSKDGTCGVCRVPAIMETEGIGAPPRLPEALPKPLFPVEDIDTAMECAKAWLPRPEPIDDKVHMCKRYVGGSHTMLNQAKQPHKHDRPIIDTGVPMRQFTGLGSDGKRYKMEERMMPCAECNAPEHIPGETSVPVDGAGDREGSRRITVVDTSNAPITVFTDEQMSRVSVPDLPQHRATRIDILRHGAPPSASQSRVGSLGNIIKGRNRSSVINESLMNHAASQQDGIAKRVSTLENAKGEDNTSHSVIQASFAEHGIESEKAANLVVEKPLLQPPAEEVQASDSVTEQPPQQTGGQTEQQQVDAQPPAE